MGFFGFGKKERVIDLSEKYRRQQEEKMLNQSKIKQSFEQKSIQNSPLFGMLNSSANSSAQIPMPSEISNNEESPEEKRRKFMQKFSEMSERLETLSTSLYHLSQRVELLEKKMNVGH